MPIEPLRCKFCGGLLDANLKCQHCGTLHEKIGNRLEIIKVCPKHFIGYSSTNCPKCVEEEQALILQKQEQARLAAERDKKLREIEAEEAKINEQIRLRREQWKKKYQKKLGVAVLLCCIIVAVIVTPIAYQSYQTRMLKDAEEAAEKARKVITVTYWIELVSQSVDRITINFNYSLESNFAVTVLPSWFCLKVTRGSETGLFLNAIIKKEYHLVSGVPQTSDPPDPYSPVITVLITDFKKFDATAVTNFQLVLSSDAPQYYTIELVQK